MALQDATPRPSGRRRVLIIALVVLMLAVVGGGGAVYMSRQGTEEKYLDALAEEDLLGEFPTERAAVIAAESACEEFERTGDPKGSTAQAVAVAHYCPEFATDFKTLAVIEPEGEFVVRDFDEYLYSDDGDYCEGEGGYGDINSSTGVLVTNGDGERLARTDLGPGEVDSGSCVFEFSFAVTEGEDQYIIAVGDRGEISFTFEELRSGGPQLSIG